MLGKALRLPARHSTERRREEAGQTGPCSPSPPRLGREGQVGTPAQVWGKDENFWRLEGRDGLPTVQRAEACFGFISIPPTVLHAHCPHLNSCKHMGPVQPMALAPLLNCPSHHNQREPQDVHLTTNPSVLSSLFLELLAIDLVIALQLSKCPVKMVLKVKTSSGLVLFGDFIWSKTEQP